MLIIINGCVICPMLSPHPRRFKRCSLSFPFVHPTECSANIAVLTDSV